MTISLLAFAGLALLALGFVIYPMVRKHVAVAEEPDVEDQHRRTHREWYQQRVAEIELESQDPEARVALQQELAAAVLAETDAIDNTNGASNQPVAALLNFRSATLALG